MCQGNTIENSNSSMSKSHLQILRKTLLLFLICHINTELTL